MDEIIYDKNALDEKEEGKSIRSYINDKDNNTIFVEKFNPKNQEFKKSFTSKATNKSDSNKFKFKKINNRSLSAIPIKLMQSSSKSNFSQFTKLNTLQLKRKIFNDTNTLNNNNQSNSSLNYISPFASMSKKIKKTNSNINLDCINNSKNFLENKELNFNESITKSNINELENKINTSNLDKTNFNKSNTVKRNYNQIQIYDEIFQNVNNNRNERNITNSIIKMNTWYGLNFKVKPIVKDKDFFKKEDFYYSKKFHV